METLKDYVLQERLGSGDLGTVYRAVQTTVKREVAIKIVPPQVANLPDFVRCFEVAMQRIALLEHMHITPIYDFWRDPEGAYLVMRYLRGGNLHDALQRGAFDLEAAATLLHQVTSALAVAHRHAIIHRDLKPANILLDEDSNAYLTDFGIARNRGGVQDMIAHPNRWIGSPGYLAPEQVRGEAVLPQTDIYSLGIILYEVLTGEHPFPGISAAERLSKHPNEPLPQIDHLESDINQSVNAIIQKATAKNPAHRYSSALAMAADFQAVCVSMRERTGEDVIALLTLREQDVLARIAQGATNRQIAEDLTITIATVRWYLKQIYRKLGVRSRVQLMIRARELDLVVGSPDMESAPTVRTGAISTRLLSEPENPYKGLRTFQVADAQDFFGCEKLIKPQ